MLTNNWIGFNGGSYSGYPDGLKGDEILLESKVVAVADVYEAMTARRPYIPVIFQNA